MKPILGVKYVRCFFIRNLRNINAIVATSILGLIILSVAGIVLIPKEITILIERPEEPREVLEVTYPSTEVVTEVTAYTASVEETDEHPTEMASGNRVYEGAIACPRNIEFGTQVEIDGEIFTCEDRMALKNDGKFDIFMWDRNSALAFGRQVKKVKIYAN